ncbi:hypothetical protein TRM7557_02237 [Tritonibacter multivorans]|uniref:Uncharacterized protein n=1 Tax=Tritonibacter multivorans TaxID=928856 RepID=A0A0P1GUA6_9RHOB|nr:hypothetical protein [Tritonibacter multivorans]MDA7419820.1 hypothetical protein [Tritonibacter multivorans]CUH79181.1 hypothetical protein TRM7557_02237 [Tritonibacter multivorans]SFC16213.1 hypothetical protein SAMN04488049_101481 [Tritonibacter multivorans]
MADVSMNPLALILGLKILVTLGLTHLFLFAPQKRLNGLMAQYGDSPLTYRLYGLTLLVLIGMYMSGLVAALGGAVSHEVLALGILSNGGAAVLMQTWSGHPTLRRASWVFAAIALALLAALLFPNQALLPLLP